MSAKFTYLLIDLGSVLVPFIFSFHPKINFKAEWKAFWQANLIVVLLFVAWDSLYTQLGVWGFNGRYLLGPALFNLPVEEVLFFICIPYASVFTYHCFKLFIRHTEKIPQRAISVLLVALLLIVGFTHLSKLYTGVTCIVLGLLIAYLGLVKKAGWLPHFYFMYLVILLPFFVVNGILTGTGPDEPVVWYNNQENLGIRLLTIPVEDLFYGMLLLLLNTWLYESFRKRA